MDTFEDLEGLQFVDKLVNGKYPVRVPAFNDRHDWWSNWEPVRFNSMEQLLRPGMLLYDVGAYDGWGSLIFSRFVGGPENIVLIEPVAENWANIRATWNENHAGIPKATFMGFLGEHDTSGDLMPMVHVGGWPTGPDYLKIISVTKFKLLHEHAANTPCLRLDSLAETVGVPDAINLDVEGAALLVLHGAGEILKEHSPLVWVSIHPEFMRERFGIHPYAIHKYMASLGYLAEFLGVDHEEHHLFRKQG